MQAAAPAAPGANSTAASSRRRRVEAVSWMCAMAALVGVTISGSTPSPYLALDIPVGVVSVALLPLLRRWPASATILLSLLCAVSPAATPPATLAVLVLAESRPLGVAVSVAGTGIAAHLVRELWRPVGGLPYGWWAVLTVVAYAALIGWGTLLRAHRALISSLRERAERAEAEQARRVAEARTAERAMIAREMHDVLAHRLSLLATYAGALAYRPDAPPGQLSRAAEVIRSGVHESLDELREVIGVLRDDTLPELAGSRAPLPGIACLPDLVEESRAAGMRVETGGSAWPIVTRAAGARAADTGTADIGTAGVEAPELPDAMGRTVFRVVQEGLTNARKHAPDEPVRVTLSGGPGVGLDISLVNQLDAGLPSWQPPTSARALGRLPGTGTGLIGLTERLELAGGRLSSGAENGEFRLHAWLPWPTTGGASEDNTAQNNAGVTVTG